MKRMSRAAAGLCCSAVFVASLAQVASADPPPQPTSPPPQPPLQQAQDDDGPRDRSVELRVEGRYLKYSYDLSGLFDTQLWRVLEDNGYSEITVEVNLRDAQDQVRLTQHHTLKIELLESGKVRVMTSARRGKIYPDREAMIRDLQRVRGKPIRAIEFPSEEGHLELVVLVNPVQVYSFPDEDTPLAERRVVPRTFYDRRVELRSRPFRQ